MIFKKPIEINRSEFLKTYSDSFCIRNGDVIYDEAIDPLNSERVYTETDIPLPERELTAEEALEIITGGAT